MAQPKMNTAIFLPILLVAIKVKADESSFEPKSIQDRGKLYAFFFFLFLVFAFSLSKLLYSFFFLNSVQLYFCSLKEMLLFLPSFCFN